MSIMKNTAGFSLVELVMVMGSVGIISLIIATQLQQGQRQLAQGEAVMEMEVMNNLLARVINQDHICFENLEGQSVGSSFDDIRINDRPFIEVGMELSSHLRISGIELEQAESFGVNFSDDFLLADMVVTFQARRGSHWIDVEKRHPLFLGKDSASGRITHCQNDSRALASSKGRSCRSLGGEFVVVTDPHDSDIEYVICQPNQDISDPFTGYELYNNKDFFEAPDSVQRAAVDRNQAHGHAGRFLAGQSCGSEQFLRGFNGFGQPVCQSY